MVFPVIQISFLKIDRSIVNSWFKRLRCIYNREIFVLRYIFLPVNGTIIRKRIIRINKNFINLIGCKRFWRCIWFYYQPDFYFMIAFTTVYLSQKIIRIKVKIAFLFKPGVNSFSFGFNNIQIIRFSNFQQTSSA